ncbi:MAG TPA: hypothetical protein VIM02_10005 [Rhizomicrobium sp.]
MKTKLLVGFVSLVVALAVTSTASMAYITNARVAARWVPQSQSLNRSKNVADFQHPTVGVFCVLPSITINTTNVYPQVSVDYGQSNTAPAFAGWLTVATNCPQGYVEIVTYTSAGNLSDDVAWDMIL